MGNHLRGRAPKKTAGFSWGRIVNSGTVTYRLFRRDQRGALHWFLRAYSADEIAHAQNIRAVIATELNRARHALRNQVDEIDLALMGVTQ